MICSSFRSKAGKLQQQGVTTLTHPDPSFVSMNWDPSLGSQLLIFLATTDLSRMFVSASPDPV